MTCSYSTTFLYVTNYDSMILTSEEDLTHWNQYIKVLLNHISFHFGL